MKLSTTEAMRKTDIPEELNIDTTWDESYSAGTPIQVALDSRF